MKFIGNLLWLLLGGLLGAAGWALVGIFYCITIIGIPIGLQCFKFAGLTLWPMGKEIAYGDGTMSMIVNIFWLIFGGIELAAGFFVIGLLLSLTIIGIPFGQQHFKLAKLALMPFGAKVYSKNRYY